jgi:TolB-like protein
MIPLALAVVVAVLPFRDLSGGKGSAGEALRETVTADLRAVSSLKVVERDALDKVIAEQDLRAQRSDLDPASTIRVGKLLGATHLVGGAYQRSGNTVRLTARFVEVQTGEVRAAAKVDGPVGDLFKLQDRITDELLRAVKITRPRTPRQKLKDFRAVELYGDAVGESDDGKRRALLQQALAVDPGFVYAEKDLDALERRMLKYAAQAAQADKARAGDAVQAFRDKLNGRKPDEIEKAYESFAEKMLESSRWRRLQSETQAMLGLPQPALTPDTREAALAVVVRCHAALRQWDDTLRTGEAFMAAYPKSKLSMAVSRHVALAIGQKREQESGKQRAERQITRELSDVARGNPCNTARFYKAHKQWQTARTRLDECMKVAVTTHHGWASRTWVLQQLAEVAAELGDYKASRSYIDTLAAEAPDKLGHLRALRNELPLDD